VVILTDLDIRIIMIQTNLNHGSLWSNIKVLNVNKDID